MPIYLGFDQQLPHRIRKFVESNPYADVDMMVEEFRKQYRNDYGKRKKAAFKNLVNKVYLSMLDDGEFAEPSKKKHKGEKETNSSSDSEAVHFEYEDTNMLNQSLLNMYNNEEDFRNLTPSKTPQSFNQSDQAPPQGWIIDKKGGKKVLKPVKNNDAAALVQADANGSKNLVPDSLEKNSIKDAPEYCQSEATIKTPKQKKNGKRKFKKKRMKSPPSELDKELKDLKEETDDVVFRNRTKFTVTHSDVTFDNVAGNNESLQELSRLLLHMSHPEIYQALGVSPPRGILLHGPPGCGKTLLGCAIAGQLDLPLLKLVGPELVTGVSGESERRVRDLFDAAIGSAPCVLFIDEIDAVAQKRENSSKDMERRIVAQILSCLDDLNKGSHQVMVVGASNKPDVLDPALRRAGRFDREICMGIPDEKARKQILSVLCSGLKLASDINFDLIARLTPGYVGADLLSLCREAAMCAVTRMFDVSEDAATRTTSSILKWLKDRTPFSEEKLSNLSIETNDFEQAVPDVQPSAKREGFATVPDVTWDDVGALEGIREELSIAILGPVRNPAAFAALGLTRASGILLAGPPGCGKTLLAKAIANESGINFVSVKGPELLNMYVGESERAVRQCFERARNSSPCVIFFDELDSLCPRRSAIESSASARVVNQMLTELDGLVSRKQVFVMAATNRPDIIDPAVLRPGRLDRTLYVGIPSADDRVKILQTITKNGTRPSLAEDVNLKELGYDSRCDGFTGADLTALVREASLNAIRNNVKHNWNVILPDEQRIRSDIKVTHKNFSDAFFKVCPSISKKDRIMYDDMRSTLEGR